MTQPKPNTMDDFNPNDARTWDDKQRAVYEVGHREGESCEGASWTFMLDEAFNIEASDPQEAKVLITAKLQEAPQSTDSLCFDCGSKLFLWDGKFRCIYDGKTQELASLKGGDV